jgi:hypothetical protein
MNNNFNIKKYFVVFVILSFIVISIIPNVSSVIKETKDIINIKKINKDSFEFYPTDLATISKMNPDENYSDFEIIPLDRETLIKFDISSLPENTPIYSAKIISKFNYYTGLNPYGFNLSCYRLTSDWSEENVTWNTKPTNHSIPTSNASIPLYFIFMSWDVKNDLLSFIKDKDYNYGWKINCENEIYENTSLGFGDPVLIINTEANQPPNNPDQPSGPIHIYPGIIYSYSTITIDPEDDYVRYGWDWNGNGTVNEEDWSEFIPSDSRHIRSFRWNTAGTYNVKVKAEDIYGEQSGFSQTLTIIVGDGFNNPPNKPSKPSGKTNGKAGEEYTYSASTTDPDGDQIFYKWDLGDETNNGWIGPFNSGEICEISHTWNEKGNYQIKVIAKDINNDESEWSDQLNISISKQKILDSISDIILWFLQHFSIP